MGKARAYVQHVRARDDDGNDNDDAEATPYIGKRMGHTGSQNPQTNICYATPAHSLP